MKTSRLASLILPLVALLLAGCSREHKDDRIVLGFSQIGAESEWRTANTESIKSAAATMNIDLRFADAQQKQENQIKALRNFIAQKVDVIAFSPVVATGWDTVLMEARDAGIPVILTDRGVTSDPSLYAGFLGSDFVEEGRKAGRWAVEQFKDPKANVNIVELQGTVGAAPAIDRKRGFEEIIASQPRFQIIRSQTGDFTRDGGKTVMEGFIQKYGLDGIDLVYAHNDDMGLGAIEAIEAAGGVPGEDITIITIDAVKDGMQALVDGKINFIVECNPLLGDLAADLVKRVLAGEEVEKAYYVVDQSFTQEQAAEVIDSRPY